MVVLAVILTPQFGAKAGGMGEAFVAVADDYTCPNWNPAGLLLMDGFMIGSTYSTFYSPEVFALGSYINTSSFKEFGIGVSYERLQASSLYVEQVVRVSGALSAFKSVYLGMNAAWISAFSPDYADLNDPAFKGRADAICLDFGLLGEVRGVRIGFLLRSFNNPPFSLLENSSNRLPPQFHLGFSYKIDAGNYGVITLAMQSSLYNYIEDIWREINFGAEFLFYRIFALRVGMARWQITAGVGASLGRWKLDFAFKTHNKLGIVLRASAGYIFTFEG